MGSDLAVDAVRGLEWLVNGRNNMQSLLLRLFQRWDSLSSTQRHTALGAAFSLWRAVFLWSDAQKTNLSIGPISPRRLSSKG